MKQPNIIYLEPIDYVKIVWHILWTYIVEVEYKS